MKKLLVLLVSMLSLEEFISLCFAILLSFVDVPAFMLQKWAY
jgi:hypothetical protein